MTFFECVDRNIEYILVIIAFLTFSIILAVVGVTYMNNDAMVRQAAVTHNCNLKGAEITCR